MTEDRSRRDASSTSRPRPSPSSPRPGAASSTSDSTGSGVRALLERHGIRPSKALGQNFLLDRNLARAIARDAGVGPGTRVVEIGAGTGSLTTALADAGAAEVLAVEFDRTLLPALRETVADRPNVRVLHADATKLDWAGVLGDGPWTLCANLPYNVGTTTVVEVVERAPSVERLVVMLQREVADRLVAHAGDDAYGAVSLRIDYRARAEIVRRVPPDVFWPRPLVGSAIVRIERRPAPLVDVDEARLWRVVETAFAERRKTIRNGVRRLGLSAEDAEDVLRRARVDGGRRPEDLDVQAFARIADAVPA